MGKLIGAIATTIAALAAITLWVAIYVGIPVLAFVALWKYVIGG